MKPIFRVLGIFTISLFIVVSTVLIIAYPILLAYNYQSLAYLLLYCIPIAIILTVQYLKEEHND